MGLSYGSRAICMHLYICFRIVFPKIPIEVWLKPRDYSNTILWLILLLIELLCQNLMHSLYLQIIVLSTLSNFSLRKPFWVWRNVWFSVNCNCWINSILCLILSYYHITSILWLCISNIAYNHLDQIFYIFKFNNYLNMYLFVFKFFYSYW